VDETGLVGGGLLEAQTDVERTRLVVGTVRARDELLVLSLEGEPGLEVVLDRGSVVEGTRNNVDNTVGDLERLVELASNVDHRVEQGGRLLGVTEDELGLSGAWSWRHLGRAASCSTHLLNLLELVDTEDTPGVTAVRASLFPEAGRVTGVAIG
jgi:hypothetical protein